MSSTPATPAQNELGRLLVEAPSTAAELVVLDGLLNRVARTTDRFDETVGPGLYRISARLGDAAESKLVAVEAGGVTQVTQSDWRISFAAAAPLEGTWTSREKHQEPAASYSRTPTRTPQGDARLFVFARKISPHATDMPSGTPFWNGLSLRAENGDPMCEFGPQETKQDLVDNWMAFVGDLSNGPHRLRIPVHSTVQRFVEIPLWLVPTFETQVFLTWTDVSKVPALSLSMAPKGRGFPAFDEGAQHDQRVAELALAGLQRGKILISDEERTRLLHGKGDNPWLGIVGAHCMLLETTPDRALLETVCGNLRAMLGDHPDVDALRLAAGERRLTLGFPPLLRASLAIVLRESASRTGVVVARSLLENVCLAMTSNGPWTTWRPDRLPDLGAATAPLPTGRRLGLAAAAVAVIATSAVGTLLSRLGFDAPRRAIVERVLVSLLDQEALPAIAKYAVPILQRALSREGALQLALGLGVPLARAERILQLVLAQEQNVAPSDKRLVDLAKAYLRSIVLSISPPTESTISNVLRSELEMLRADEAIAPEVATTAERVLSLLDHEDDMLESQATTNTDTVPLLPDRTKRATDRSLDTLVWELRIAAREVRAEEPASSAVAKVVDVLTVIADMLSGAADYDLAPRSPPPIPIA